MENTKRERTYLLITVFCLAISALLIFCIIADAPIPHGEEKLTHIPPHQQKKDSGEKADVSDSQMAITEAYCSEMLSQYLPAEFPVKKISVDIQETGKITLSAESGKKEIENYLKKQKIDLSLQQKLLLGLLPKEFDLSAEFDCSTAEDGGTLLTIPQKAAYNGVEIALDELPAGFLADMGEAVNRLLVNTGYYFTEIKISDGAILLLSPSEK